MSAGPTDVTAPDDRRLDDLVVRLRARIARDDLGPGERLGDERTLAASLGVSRATLRAALARLEADGLVRRTIGRSGGARISDGRIERNLNTIEGLPDIARRQGVVVHTRVLRVELELAGPRERRLLRLGDGAGVYHLVRLRVADERPLSIEASHLPADLFPRLHLEDLTSLYRTLRSVYGVQVEYADESLETVEADPWQSDLLAVPVGASLLHVQRVATGSSGRPVELAHEHFVADRMRFHLRKYGYVAPPRSTDQHHHQEGQ